MRFNEKERSTLSHSQLLEESCEDPPNLASRQVDTARETRENSKDTELVQTQALTKQSVFTSVKSKETQGQLTKIRY